MEIWKDIIGYEGIYQVSNLGNIKSIERQAWNGFKWHTLKGRILKIVYPKSEKKYPTVALCRDGKPITNSVHKLVAMAFHDNPENKPQVNHKDGNKRNNTANNLEWSTSSENVKHSFDIGLRVGSGIGRFNELSGTSRPLMQMDLQGNHIKTWPSVAEVCRVFGYKHGAIGPAARGIRPTSYGFKWQYIK